MGGGEDGLEGHVHFASWGRDVVSPSVQVMEPCGLGGRDESVVFHVRRLRLDHKGDARVDGGLFVEIAVPMLRWWGVDGVLTHGRGGL